MEYGIWNMENGNSFFFGCFKFPSVLFRCLLLLLVAFTLPRTKRKSFALTRDSSFAVLLASFDLAFYFPGCRAIDGMVVIVCLWRAFGVDLTLKCWLINV